MYWWKEHGHHDLNVPHVMRTVYTAAPAKTMSCVAVRTPDDVALPGAQPGFRLLMII